MSAHRIGSVVFALAIAGCVVNGKKVFDLGDLGGAKGASSTSTSRSSPATAPAVETSSSSEPEPEQQPAQTAQTEQTPMQPDAPKPAWCADAGNIHAGIDTALGDDFDRSLPAIVGVICNPTDDTQRSYRAKVEANRQAWMKRLGMNEADWAGDVMEWLQIPEALRNGSEVSGKGGVWSTRGPVQQFALLDQLGGVAGHYVADALKLTQAGRLAYLLQCVRTTYSADNNKPLDWAACLPDVERLDVAALGQELRTDKDSTSEERMTVRRTLDDLQRRLPKFKAKLDKLLADPAYAKMVDVGTKAATAWPSVAKDHADLLALVQIADDVRSGNASQLANCAEKSRDALIAAIAAVGTSGFTGAPDGARSYETLLAPISRGIDGYLAADAYVSCNSGTDAIAGYIEQAMEGPGYRGPRTAALTAMIEAGAYSDKHSEQFDTGSIRFSGRSYTGTQSGDREGVIAAARRKGDRVTVEFPKKSHIEDQCAKWVRTNRVERITEYGQLIYEERCTKRHKVSVNDTPSPVTVDARYAAGLEPGAYLIASQGYVLAVWADATAKQPKVVLGVELK